MNIAQIISKVTEKISEDSIVSNSNVNPQTLSNMLNSIIAANSVLEACGFAIVEKKDPAPLN